MKTVRYYDLSNISYAGLFLEGFRENERGYGVELQISYDSPPELKELELEKDEQALALGLGSICIFRYEGPGEESLFIVDASDRNWADGDIIEQQEKLLRRCKYYFKINYNSAAISGNEKLAAYAEKIKPISIVYPAAPHRWWRYLPRWTPFGRNNWTVAKARTRLQRLRSMPSTEEYRRLRSIDRDIDVFLLSAYRHNIEIEEHENQNRNRLIIFEQLQKQANLNLSIGFVSRGNDRSMPEAYAKFSTAPIGLDEYLVQMARSRIGLYLRGTHGCLSFKFGELMALGRPIKGETILNNRENLYAYDSFSEQFAFDDPYELVDQIVDLLSKPEELEELARINTQTFEQYLAPKPVTAGILDVLEGN